MLVPAPQVDDGEAELTAPVDVERPLGVAELSAWARRLLEMLHARELIELGKVNLDELTYQLGGLLQAHGTEAEHSMDTADWLPDEIRAVRGVGKLFATRGELHSALRAARLGGEAPPRRG